MKKKQRFSLPWYVVLARLRAALLEAGLASTQSFDLQSARRSLRDPEECTCSYHGTADCTCQYIVLLAKRPGATPTALELHGHDESTWLSIVSPLDEADPLTLEQVWLAVRRIMPIREPPST